jgi:hypothetical protein
MCLLLYSQQIGEKGVVEIIETVIGKLEINNLAIHHHVQTASVCLVKEPMRT